MKTLLFISTLLLLIACTKSQEYCWNCDHTQISAYDTIRYVTQPCNLNSEQIVEYRKFNTYQMLYEGKVVYDMSVHCMKLTCPE